MVEFLSGDHIIHRLVSNEPAISKDVFAVPEKPVVKPKLTIKKEEAGVILRFSNFEGDSIKIFSKRSSEDSFSLLAEIDKGEFIDTRPNLFGAPELREYMAQFTKDNTQIGQNSDVVLIIKK